MIKKYGIKWIWLSIGIVSMLLIMARWVGYDSQNLQHVVLVFNTIGFLLSLPCSLAVIPVSAASSYFMAMYPMSGEGIYLNTILIFVIGLTQWFWIARFWSGASHRVQTLNLKGAETGR